MKRPKRSKPPLPPQPPPIRIVREGREPITGDYKIDWTWPLIIGFFLFMLALYG